MTLALQAHDEEDLAVISAHLQDAVGVVGEMAYVPKKRRFALLLSRFVWHDPENKAAARGEKPKRVRAGVHVEGVEKVQVKGLPQDDPEAAYELLAITFQPSPQDEDPSGVLEMAFAGGDTLRLSVECIEVFMADIGEPWTAQSRPRHPGA